MSQLQTRVKDGLTWLDADCPCSVQPAGWRAFQLGLFFLPTSALISGLALLASLTLWRPTAEPKPLSRPLARLLLLLSIWLAVTALAAGGTLEVRLRVFNWLPFFWFVLAVQPYVAAPTSRRRLGLMVVIATVPALLVGLSQALFHWSGPWTGLWGLLNWDLPSRFAHQGSGVFPNPNFTAAWYGMVLPLLATETLMGRQRLTANATLLLLTLAIVLTGSRTVLSGGAVSLLLLAWTRFWKPLSVLAIALTLVVSAAVWLPDSNPIAALAERVSGDLAEKMSNMAHGAGSTAAEAIAAGRQPFRSELFAQAFSFVATHPWLGLAEPLIGLPAVTPPALMTHTHNVLFQLAIQHGLIAALLLVGVVSWLIAAACLRLKTSCLGDRALVISGLMAVWLHAYDIPSFDSRNNMLGWLLLGCCLAISQTGSADADTRTMA